MRRSKISGRALAAMIGICVALALSPTPQAWAGEAVASVPSPAQVWLRTIEPDPELQAFLDQRVKALRKRDPALQRQTIRVSLIDIPTNGPPKLAHWNGDLPVYPASVPKFAYLMAVYEWRDHGALEIDSELDRLLTQMVYASSNRATQKVVARLTGTQPGPRLEPEAYAEFVEKRHAVKRWLRELGVTDLHLVHPTYDGGGDLYGREVQFLEDIEVEGSLPHQTGKYRNRAAMTSNGTAELLALLATDHALSPETSAEVRERLRRTTRKQRYLKYRIAGGAEQCGVKGVEVFAKTGTYGAIHADAGIVRAPSGRQLIVVAFLEGAPRYKGSFIAQIAEAACRQVLTPDAGG
jgi:beta-lactamase class A